ncbi:hypothetical protein DF125_02765 [Burkholderia pseudomallei]|nr:hypothetical protein DF127_05615 [Burkholderia pseudomallei]RQS98997.1 hypothetical protein DF125_02765 [Burkholderia pseudomallei]
MCRSRRSIAPLPQIDACSDSGMLSTPPSTPVCPAMVQSPYIEPTNTAAPVAMPVRMGNPTSTYGWSLSRFLGGDAKK